MVQQENVFQSAQRALQERRWADAEVLLKRIILLEPANPGALFGLVSVLGQLRRFDEAQLHIGSLLKADPSPKAKELAAFVYNKLGNAAAAMGLSHDVAVQLNDPAKWHQLGDQYAQLRMTPNASDAYRSAFVLAPSRIDSALKYFVHADAVGLEQFICDLRNALGSAKLAIGHQCALQRLLVMAVEKFSRHKNGYWKDLCASFDEVFLRFAQAESAQWQASCLEWFKAEPENAAALSYYLSAGLVDEKYWLTTTDIANAYTHGSQEVVVSAVLDDSFYQRLEAAEDRDLLRGLPPAKIVAESKNVPPRAFFVGCDQVYFEKYALALLGSAIDKTSSTAFHVHVFDADEKRLRDLFESITRRSSIPLRFSVEQTGRTGQQAKEYYHAIRFVRLLEYGDLYPSGVFALDADFLFARNPETMFSVLVEHDIALPMQPGRTEVYNRIAAGIVGITIKPAARRYLKLVAGYLAEACRTDRLIWGIDQLVLYLCMLYLRRTGVAISIAPVTSVFCGPFHSESVLWPGKFAAEDISRDIYDRLVSEAISRTGV